MYLQGCRRALALRSLRLQEYQQGTDEEAARLFFADTVEHDQATNSNVESIHQGMTTTNPFLTNVADGDMRCNIWLGGSAALTTVWYPDMSIHADDDLNRLSDNSGKDFCPLVPRHLPQTLLNGTMGVVAKGAGGKQVLQVIFAA